MTTNKNAGNLSLKQKLPTNYYHIETGRGMPSLLEQIPFMAKQVVHTRRLRSIWVVVTPQCLACLSDLALGLPMCYLTTCFHGHLSRKFLYAVLLL